MPSNSIRLFREDPLSPEEWAEVIHARADRLARQLFDKVTLPVLADARCLGDHEGLCVKQIGRIIPAVNYAWDDFGLETQGIFVWFPETRILGDLDGEGDAQPDNERAAVGGSFLVVGLTRRPRAWILVRVAYLTEPNGREEYATQVKIREESLSAILNLKGVHPANILRGMTDFAGGLVSEYERRLRDVEFMHRGMTVEDELLSLIPGNDPASD